MRRFRKMMVFGAGLILLSTTNLALAQNFKMAYVNAQQILEESKAGQRTIKARDELAKEKNAELEKMREEIIRLDKELDRKQLVLSVEAKNKLEKDIQQKQVELKRTQEDAAMALKQFDRDSLKQINDAAMEVIKKLGKDEGYDIILEARESNILYASEAMDITEKIIKLYDAQTEKKK